jgi:hypothetical protein
MRPHLEEIGRHVAPGAHAVVALDGAGRHGAPRLVTPGDLTLPPLPAYYYGVTRCVKPLISLPYLARMIGQNCLVKSTA